MLASVRAMHAAAKAILAERASGTIEDAAAIAMAAKAAQRASEKLALTLFLAGQED